MGFKCQSSDSFHIPRVVDAAYIFPRIALQNAKSRDFKLKRAGQFLDQPLAMMHDIRFHEFSPARL